MATFEEIVSKLTRKRRALKRALTQQESFFASRTFENLSDIELEEVSLRNTKVEELYNQFDSNETELEEIQDDDDGNERTEFESRIFALWPKIKVILKNHSPNASDPSVNRAAPSEFPNVKLPEITLPTFSGEFTSWLNFRDIFKSIVIDNTALSNIARFYYLSSSLSGEAKALIKNIQPSDENFTVAWSLLTNRYDNTRLIATSHITQLFAPPTLESGSATSLRSLIDHFSSHVQALEALDLNDSSVQDLMMSHFIINLLDTGTIKEWESQTQPDRIPTLNELLAFLERRCKILEFVNNSSSQASPVETKPKQNTKVHSTLLSHLQSCPKCRGNHALYGCSSFLGLAPHERKSFVLSRSLCINCLKPYGNKHVCSKSSCRQCGKAHNTLLHINNSPSTRAQITSTKPDNHGDTRGHVVALRSGSPHHSANGPVHPVKDNAWSQGATSPSRSHSYHGVGRSQHKQSDKVLLATAQVKLIDPRGRSVYCTALLDSGSDCSLITRRTAEALQLTIKPSRTEIHSLWTKLFQNYLSHLLKRPTGPYPPNLELADPEFFRPKPIDILLGANIFFEILRPRKFTPRGNLPFIQETELGWILSGKTSIVNNNEDTRISAATLSRADVQTQLQKFWEIEEVDAPIPTSDEEHCEQHFSTNTSRDHDGRYVVRLPFSPDAKPLGNSLASATKRLHSLERRLERDSDLRSQYLDFMMEYLELDHMEPAPYRRDNNCYFIPHHPVFKPSSTTTKLRVVFDASASSSNGISLNSNLLAGPVLQQDLFSIVLRFRTHVYAYAADITKMYRQVLIHPDDRDFQRILWRPSSTSEVQQYRLKTVTYGTTSASYLAIRALRQLVFDDGNSYPLASDAIFNDFYVDDLISGADTPEQALSTYHQLNSLLPLGGFHLRKWSTNCEPLALTIPSDHLESSELRSFGESQNQTVVKTLGLYWQSSLDTFYIQTISPDSIAASKLTKRTLLSLIASIFDPLGLIAPIVTTCKVIIQSLWAIKLDWDSPVPDDIAKAWCEVARQLPSIADIAIPRLIKCTGSVAQLHLHGFADASETAYGACLYLHSLDSQGNSTTRLICAKSRVAPLKTLSIPRLELCAALLLANLLAKTSKALSLNLDSCNLWSDSTIVLAWLSAPPSKWTTFVANRVSQIQNLTKDCVWRHVSSRDNPADLVSRGVAPHELKTSSLWWSGPSWITDSSVHCLPPDIKRTDDDIPELRRCHLTVTKNFLDSTLLKRFSSHVKTVRVLAYCLRFITNCKSSVKMSGPLTATELDKAFNTCVKIVQAQYYPNELAALAKREPLPAKSVLASLHPFMHSDGLLRVGGRLTHSNLPFESKHQMILPRDHPFTRNFVRHTHHRLLHAGAQCLTAALRQSIWIPSIRRLVRAVIHSCLICFKLKAQAAEQLMADLPAVRVSQSFPFMNVGIDYCGPFLIKFGGPRSKISTKSYVALFVCMATKAIHLEIVTSMSTEAFIAAFTRFCSRRGTPSQVFSDNGSNFVGANHELKELATLLASELHQHAVQDATSHLSVQWFFIPPRAPHFGGLWEAGVKSFKHHLRRVTTSHMLTYEEFSTLSSQIEAVLNSRPISPLSEDPTDSQFLSPGHFLIGRPITALPTPNLLDLPSNRLSRWQLLQRLLQSLWHKWSLDYLQSLQQRSKWRSVAANLTPGTVVLLKEDGTPPLHWVTAIVDQVHPGSDGLVRTITLRTPSGSFKRPISKVCPLPIDSSESDVPQTLP